jgi:hypothetical protein
LHNLVKTLTMLKLALIYEFRITVHFVEEFKQN